MYAARLHVCSLQWSSECHAHLSILPFSVALMHIFVVEQLYIKTSDQLNVHVVHDIIGNSSAMQCSAGFLKMQFLLNLPAGKSSLLESITKCPIFPRGDNMSTRAPVCLRMEHVQSSSDAVTEISFGNEPVERLVNEAAIVEAVRRRMDRIPAGTIVGTPITVRICKSEVRLVYLVKI